jgi:uncharacterized YigZ family protein
VPAPTSRYPIPAGRHRVEQIIRRSRFITTLAPAPTAEAAHAFIDTIRLEFPDATHNCWAFAAGPPGATAAVGMSDDGEPHGTAGRPMLEALLHSGVGEVAAVVTRYYGGVKLGKGGLQRAYSGGVKHALESLPRGERVDRVSRVVTLEYAALDAIRRAASELDVEIRAEHFTDDVRLDVAIPAGSIEAFSDTVAELTAGKGRVREEESVAGLDLDRPAPDRGDEG